MPVVILVIVVEAVAVVVAKGAAVFIIVSCKKVRRGQYSTDSLVDGGLQRCNIRDVQSECNRLPALLLTQAHSVLQQLTGVAWSVIRIRYSATAKLFTQVGGSLVGRLIGR